MMRHSENHHISFAKKLVTYYQNLVKETSCWKKNLTLAEEWLELLSQREPDVEKVRNFLTRIESDDLHDGTAWYELRQAANRWAKQVL